MKKTYKAYGILLMSALVIVIVGTGCSTRLGLGFGFGSGGSSVSLGVSTTLPREKADPWTIQGSSLLLKVGEHATLTFPAGGSSEGKIWGTGLYAESSNIGMAAVHSGLITFEEGGTVSVRWEKKTSIFIGTIRNGLESLSSQKSAHAFSFIHKNN